MKAQALAIISVIYWAFPGALISHAILPSQDAACRRWLADPNGLQFKGGLGSLHYTRNRTWSTSAEERSLRSATSWPQPTAQTGIQRHLSLYRLSQIRCSPLRDKNTMMVKRNFDLGKKMKTICSFVAISLKLKCYSTFDPIRLFFVAAVLGTKKFQFQCFEKLRKDSTWPP